MKIYLSGAITNTRNYKRIFEKYEKIVKDDHPESEVVNPVRLCEDISADAPHEVFMARCLKALEECDVICLIAGWKKSKGARMELMRALELDMEIWSW